MKQLITVLALAGGVAATGVVLTVQNNPMAFTTPMMEPARAAPATLILAEVDVVAAPPRAQEEAEEQNDVVADLKRVVRRATAASFPTEPVLERAIERAAPKPRPAAPPPPAVQEESEPEVTVVSAPCQDGEYRKLDEHRGVRLMCFGQ